MLHKELCGWGGVVFAGQPYVRPLSCGSQVMVWKTNFDRFLEDYVGGLALKAPCDPALQRPPALPAQPAIARPPHSSPSTTPGPRGRAANANAAAHAQPRATSAGLGGAAASGVVQQQQAGGGQAGGQLLVQQEGAQAEASSVRLVWDHGLLACTPCK